MTLATASSFVPGSTHLVGNYRACSLVKAVRSGDGVITFKAIRHQRTFAVAITLEKLRVDIDHLINLEQNEGIQL